MDRVGALTRPEVGQGRGRNGWGKGWAPGCQLTTPHKLQGRGEVSKPIPGTVGLRLGWRQPTAAPRLVHALVRWLTKSAHGGRERS